MENNRIKNAIVLAAGLGIRLRPLTEDTPKPLVKVHEKELLINCIEKLERRGFENTIIVIGYLGHKIKERVGNRFGNMNISYIENNHYEETNNVYSLWLAKEYLEKGALLVEGDEIFEEEILKRTLEFDNTLPCWVADKFTGIMNGFMLIADREGRIFEIKHVKEKLAEYKDTYYKVAGIVKITEEYGKLFSKWLDEEVKNKNVKTYYDLILAKHFNEVPIYICSIAGLKWFEIDNEEDLRKAEHLFPM